jgi:hypothetical protein
VTPVKGIHVSSEKKPDPVLAYADRVKTILDEEYPMVREYISRRDILAMAKALRNGVPEEEIRACLAEIAKMSKEAFVRGVTSKTPSIPIPR